MEETRHYLTRKYEELLLISGCLRPPECPRPESVESIIEKKFQLAAQLKSEHALNTWRNTETLWCATALRSGPYRFHYRYQRADLTVSGPFPYRDFASIPEAELYGVVYACSGMGAVSAVLLALSGSEDTTLAHLPGCYKETLELATNCVPTLHCHCLEPGKPIGASRHRRTILWLDAPQRIGPSLADLACIARAADVIVFDTTCFCADSARIRRSLHWAMSVGTPVVLIRSHTKLDTLGIEYGRLGSAVFIAFRNGLARDRRRMARLAEKAETAVRLLGNRALPAQFCPFAGSSTYWTLSRRRSAALLRNGRLLARTLVHQLGRPAVRNYPHGMFTGLVPPYNLQEVGAAAEAERLAASLASRSLPVRHAGSFGFDFTAIEGFFDTEIDRHIIRIAIGDVPGRIVTEAADQIASWWSARWSARAA